MAEQELVFRRMVISKMNNSMEEWNLVDVWEPLYGGTGMGVWSMWYLVWTEVIGSELSVHSRCGRGSTGPVWLSRES